MSWARARTRSRARRSGARCSRTLTARGTLTLATTHLGALKELATEVPGVVNASLEFDAVRLAPTYRLDQGRAGSVLWPEHRSAAGAARVGLARAEARVPQVRARRRGVAGGSAAARRPSWPSGSSAAAESLATDVTYRTERVDARERDRAGAGARGRAAVAPGSSPVSAQRAGPGRADRARAAEATPAAAAAERSEHARRARQRVEQLAAEQGEALTALDAMPPVARPPQRCRHGSSWTAGIERWRDGGGAVARRTRRRGCRHTGWRRGRGRRRAQDARTSGDPAAAPRVPRRKSQCRGAPDVPKCTRTRRSTSGGCGSWKSKKSCMHAIDAAVRADLPSCASSMARGRARSASGSARCCARTRG